MKIKAIDFSSYLWQSFGDALVPAHTMHRLVTALELQFPAELLSSRVDCSRVSFPLECAQKTSKGNCPGGILSTCPNNLRRLLLMWRSIGPPSKDIFIWAHKPSDYTSAYRSTVAFAPMFLRFKFSLYTSRWWSWTALLPWRKVVINWTLGQSMSFQKAWNFSGLLHEICMFSLHIDGISLGTLASYNSLKTWLLGKLVSLSPQPLWKPAWSSG